MRAILCREFGRDTIAIEEVDAPLAGAGQILVDVAATSVNFVDLLSIDGKYQNTPPLPFVPGHEVAGTVAAVGKGVSGFSSGDRVLSHLPWGAFAEQAAARASVSARMPDAMGFDVAAAMGLGHLTAWFGLVERGGVKAGDTVLVTGASGGVGLAAVEVAKALGARVLGAVGTASKAQAVREAGADAIVDLNAENLKESLRDQVLAANDGRGANLVLDVLGGDVFDACLRAVAPEGRVVVAGFMSGRIPEIRTNYLLLKNISVEGMTTAHYMKNEPERLGAAQEKLFALFEAGKLRPRVMASYPFEKFREAFGVLWERKVVGKVVLTL